MNPVAFFPNLDVPGQDVRRRFSETVSVNGNRSEMKRESLSKSATASCLGEAPQVIDERRVLPRFLLQIPVLLTLPESQMKIPAKTCNVSASGVLFYADRSIRENEQIEFVMRFPAEITPTPLEVACRATVVRSAMDAITGRVAIAVSLKGFDFLIPDRIAAAKFI